MKNEEKLRFKIIPTKKKILIYDTKHKIKGLQYNIYKISMKSKDLFFKD